VLLIDADVFGALGRVRMYWGSGTNIDGSTRYLAGVVDRYAHPDRAASPRPVGSQLPWTGGLPQLVPGGGLTSWLLS
jgi:hypothetical protein